MEKKLGDRLFHPHRKTNPATASALTVSGTCIFYGISLITDGSNDVTLNVYDNTTAAGTRIIPGGIVIDGASKFAAIDESSGLTVANGIYVNISCAGTYSYQVYYDID